MGGQAHVLVEEGCIRGAEDGIRGAIPNGQQWEGIQSFEETAHKRKLSIHRYELLILRAKSEVM